MRRDEIKQNFIPADDEFFNLINERWKEKISDRMKLNKKVSPCVRRFIMSIQLFHKKLQQ